MSHTAKSFLDLCHGEMTECPGIRARIRTEIQSCSEYCPKFVSWKASNNKIFGIYVLKYPGPMTDIRKRLRNFYEYRFHILMSPQYPVHDNTLCV